MTKDGLHSKKMDNRLCAGGLLYTRLFELSERVHLANRRPTTRLPKDREIFELLGSSHRRPD